jgi:hypothetical protein
VIAGLAATAEDPKGEGSPETANAATIRLATEFRAGAIAHSRVLPTLVAEESAPFAGILQSGARTGLTRLLAASFSKSVRFPTEHFRPFA